MRVVVDGRPVVLEPHALLGTGGEARVYRWGDRAIKVYHSVDQPPAPDRRVAARRLTKIERFPRGLPDEVVGPLALAREAKSGDPVGFVMRLVEGGWDMRRLKQPSFCRRHVSFEDVTAVFGRLHQLLGRLHDRGVVVGDLNETNVLVAGGRPWLIDADSMQYGGFPCPMAHQDTLDPRLYGVDLSSAPRFTPETDWYAFAVLLFQSLLWVHPYGGVHPRYPTALRRAEAGHSILRTDVRRPKAARPPESLPEELIEHFGAVFDGGRRGPLPGRLLELRWERCGCGFVHARSACPRCWQGSAPSRQPVERVHGPCRVVRLFESPGYILLAAWRGGLRVLHQHDGVVRREDGSAVLTQPLDPGMRFALAGPTTWIGWAGRLVAVRDEQPVERMSCDCCAGLPSFDASPTSCVRALDGWLLDGATGRRLGQVLEGQTWVRLGDRLGVALYRAGRITVGFVFIQGRPGLRRVELPELPGRVLDLEATFDGDRVLLEVALEASGQVLHRVLLIDEGGRVLAQLEGPPDAHPLLERVGGKLMRGDQVFVPTDRGLLTAHLDRAARTLRAGRLWADAEPFVNAQCSLSNGPAGTVLAVHPREVLQLHLNLEESP